MTEFRTHQEIIWDERCASVPRYVVCAANRYGDIVIAGARHHDQVMRSAICAVGGWDWGMGHKILLNEGEEEQGFIDQYGVFMTREEATFIVLANKQPLRVSPPSGSELMSENLY